MDKVLIKVRVIVSMFYESIFRIRCFEPSVWTRSLRHIFKNGGVWRTVIFKPPACPKHRLQVCLEWQPWADLHGKLHHLAMSKEEYDRKLA